MNRSPVGGSHRDLRALHTVALGAYRAVHWAAALLSHLPSRVGYFSLLLYFQSPARSVGGVLGSVGGGRTNEHACMHVSCFEQDVQNLDISHRQAAAAVRAAGGRSAAALAPISDWEARLQARPGQGGWRLVDGGWRPGDSAAAAGLRYGRLASAWARPRSVPAPTDGRLTERYRRPWLAQRPA